VVLADQLKSLEWKARQAAKIRRLRADALQDVLARLAPLLGY
jgi:mRNA-degrading endonuclease toxin of MazEF toxin-antitoxin module